MKAILNLSNLTEFTAPINLCCGISIGMKSRGLIGLDQQIHVAQMFEFGEMLTEPYMTLYYN